MMLTDELRADGATEEEGEHADRREKREPKLTEKGLEYQKSLKYKERQYALRMLDKKSDSLRNLLEKDSDIGSVRVAYVAWLTMYEDCLDQHQAYQKLLNSSELEEDNVEFDTKNNNFKTIKGDCEKWILMHDRAPSVKFDSKSKSSRRSSKSGISDISSQISIAKLKESQRKAELLAKAKLLEEKQRIEQEKLNLKLKEEQFQINTEMAISDARAKAIDNMERSMEVENELNDAGYATGLNPGAPEWLPTPNVNITSTSQPNTNHRAEGENIHAVVNKTGELNVNSSQLLSVAHELNKPKAEILKFKGDPIDFIRFKRQFEIQVCKNTESYDERLNYLLQFTEAEAHKIALGYSHLDAESGYKAAMIEFEERYGDSDVIARAYVKKALDWQKIDKPKDLDNFSIFLKECLYAVNNIDSLKTLEYSENLRRLVQKLPYPLHERWRNLVFQKKESKQTVSFKTLVDFVQKEAKKAVDPIYGREIMSVYNDKKVVTSKNIKSFGSVTNTEGSSLVQDADLCTYCKGRHILGYCKSIAEIPLKERYAFLRSKGLCFGCLRPGHVKSKCRDKCVCQYCEGRHPTILHVEPAQSKDIVNDIQTKSSATNMGAGKQALPVVPVRIKCKESGHYIETYAFLDSGSNATFCLQSIADALGVQGRRKNIGIKTLNGEHSQCTSQLNNLEVCSLDGKSTVSLGPVYTRPELPVTETDIVGQDELCRWNYLKDVPIQRIDKEASVGLLIGVDTPKAMEPWSVIPSEHGGPFAVKTILGWVINGPIDLPSDCKGRFTANYIQVERPTLEDQVDNYFNLDFNEKTACERIELSVEDKCFLDIVSNSVKRVDGHYVIDLPFKETQRELACNRAQAMTRLSMLKKRFRRDSVFMNQYIEFMNKVIEKGYCEKVKPEDLKHPAWYLPHHGVIHPTKGKLRVVFDCAARYCGVSLNDNLLSGPNLANTLVGTLLRFRQEEVAIIGDIESMFYQVHVPQSMCIRYQRFLWWDRGEIDSQPTEYYMNVHLFGSTSSPSCANFALKQAAIDCKGRFAEEVIDTVFRNFYVDDCLKSVDTAKRAISLIQDVKSVLSYGGFHISKWLSNNRDVMESISPADRAKVTVDMDLDRDALPIDRALGLSWSADTDAFYFTVNVKHHELTRRGLLSTISSIYDPLGFLSPLLLNAKAVLQELCALKLAWDDPLPDKYATKWNKIVADMQKVNNFKVARCFKPKGFGEVTKAELHHFSDASDKGYGIVSYLRLTNSQGDICCSFVVGKSRVAPLKKVTIPRLELTAATVAVRTDMMLRNELDIHLDRSVFWTDSMSVLRYVKNTSSRFQTFVANRITVIHRGSNTENWRYVNTKLNPADLASRGFAADEKLWTERWIKAPEFLWNNNLKESVTLTEEELKVPSDDPEVKAVKVSAATACVDEVQTGVECVNEYISKCSSWYKLKRRVAWIIKIRQGLLRRVSLRKGTDKDLFECKTCENLTMDDLIAAEKAIVSFVQRSAFADEIKCLSEGKMSVARSSCIRKLDPYLSEGLLCVGGRLQRSRLPEEAKHPAILPKNHPVSEMILHDIHNRILHGGRNHMLSCLRAKYWLVNAPSAVRKVLSKCVKCRRHKAKVGEQKMSHLPEDRVVPDEPPFTRVGVDYFGPFEVKLKRSHVKRYGVIFTCFASRAVHIEVAHSLDTSSYINALRRFIARRGQVTKMRSDNGTNFIGAEREMRSSIEAWNVSQIHESMLQRGIDWQFNPPAGSHHGGVWERLIRSIRNAMNITLKQQVLDDEGLQTLMCEVESVLNSRPITRESNQCNDLEALTPNHLLLLKRKPNLPPGLFTSADNYAKRRWKQVQYMADLFWKRWLREYLPLLHERQKWMDIRRNLKVDDVVLIVDSSAPRNSWPLGRVIETMPDMFGFVRIVKVKTATNTLTRPIDKLCLVLEAE